MPDNALAQGGDEPKKFIRTFAGDVAAVQSGAHPDLTPLEKTPVPSPLPPPAPLPTTPPKPPVASPASTPSTPPPQPPPQTENERAAVLARLNANAKPPAEPAPQPPAPTSSQPVAPPPQEDFAALKAKREAEREEIEARLSAAAAKAPAPPPLSAPSPKAAAPISKEVPQQAASLHTYVSDFSDQYKKTGASTASMLAAEQDAGTPPPDMPPTRSRWGTILLIVGTVVLLGGGGVSAYVAYMYKTSHPVSVAPTPTVTAPIFVDERVKISGTGLVLRGAIENSIAEPLPINNIRLLYIGNGTSTDIFSALQLPAPGLLLRNINPQESFAGIINAIGNSSPFFVISVASYRDTFAGMLEWESRMRGDLIDLFPDYQAELIPLPVATTTATTTDSKTAPKKKTASTTPVVIVPPPPGFHDEVIGNHDTRVYRDSNGKSVFLYGYWNPSTLIIARDEASFTELVSRLGGSRTQE